MKPIFMASLASCALAFPVLAQSAPASAKPAGDAAAPRATTPESKPAKDAAPADPAAMESAAAEYFEVATLKDVASGLKFTEGPLWMTDGRLLFCDLQAGTMYTIKPPTKLDEIKEPLKADEFRKPSERAAGTTYDREGRLVVAHFTGKITRTDAAGKVTTIAEECDGKKFGKCNDVVVRADGVTYFTDFGGGKDGSKGVFMLGTDGKTALLSTTPKMANGLCLSPDEKTLYVADFGDQKVYAYDVASNGSTSNERLFVDLSNEKGGGTPDGMKVDEKGNLYTTGPGGIWVVSAKGEKLAVLKVPGGANNFCFGGDDAKTVFIASGGKIKAVRAKNAGILPAKQIKK